MSAQTHSPKIPLRGTTTAADAPELAKPPQPNKPEQPTPDLPELHDDPLVASPDAQMPKTSACEVLQPDLERIWQQQVKIGGWNGSVTWLALCFGHGKTRNGRFEVKRGALSMPTVGGMPKKEALGDHEVPKKEASSLPKPPNSQNSESQTPILPAILPVGVNLGNLPTKPLLKKQALASLLGTIAASKARTLSPQSWTGAANAVMKRMGPLFSQGGALGDPIATGQLGVGPGSATRNQGGFDFATSGVKTAEDWGDVPQPKDMRGMAAPMGGTISAKTPAPKPPAPAPKPAVQAPAGLEATAPGKAPAPPAVDPYKSPLAGYWSGHQLKPMGQITHQPMLNTMIRRFISRDLGKSQRDAANAVYDMMGGRTEPSRWQGYGNSQWKLMPDGSIQYAITEDNPWEGYDEASELSKPGVPAEDVLRIMKLYSQQGVEGNPEYNPTYSGYTTKPRGEGKIPWYIHSWAAPKMEKQQADSQYPYCKQAADRWDPYRGPDGGKKLWDWATTPKEEEKTANHALQACLLGASLGAGQVKEAANPFGRLLRRAPKPRIKPPTRIPPTMPRPTRPIPVAGGHVVHAPKPTAAQEASALAAMKPIGKKVVQTAKQTGAKAKKGLRSAVGAAPDQSTLGAVAGHVTHTGQQPFWKGQSWKQRAANIWNTAVRPKFPGLDRAPGAKAGERALDRTRQAAGTAARYAPLASIPASVGIGAYQGYHNIPESVGFTATNIERPELERDMDAARRALQAKVDERLGPEHNIGYDEATPEEQKLWDVWLNRIDDYNNAGMAAGRRVAPGFWPKATGALVGPANNPVNAAVQEYTRRSATQAAREALRGEEGKYKADMGPLHTFRKYWRVTPAQWAASALARQAGGFLPDESEKTIRRDVATKYLPGVLENPELAKQSPAYDIYQQAVGQPDEIAERIGPVSGAYAGMAAEQKLPNQELMYKVAPTRPSADPNAGFHHTPRSMAAWTTYNTAKPVAGSRRAAQLAKTVSRTGTAPQTYEAAVERMPKEQLAQVAQAVHDPATALQQHPEVAQDAAQALRSAQQEGKPLTDAVKRFLVHQAKMRGPGVVASKTNIPEEDINQAIQALRTRDPSQIPLSVKAYASARGVQGLQKLGLSWWESVQLMMAAKKRSRQAQDIYGVFERFGVPQKIQQKFQGRSQ